MSMAGKHSVRLAVDDHSVLLARAEAAKEFHDQLASKTPEPLNTSGFIPLDLRVLVRPDPVSDKIGSLYKPESVRERDEWAQTKATVIAVGDNAWEEAKGRSTAFIAPAPGDRILYGKHSGQRLDGDDGEKYVIMNDEDILARLEGE